MNDKTTLTLTEPVIVLAGDPLEDVTIEDMQKRIENIKSTQDLVAAYADVHDKFFYIEDDIYDYENGTPEYEAAYENVCAWERIMNSLEAKVVEEAKNEGMISEPNSGMIRMLESFMRKYGYYNGNGWWLEIEEEV